MDLSVKGAAPIHSRRVISLHRSEWASWLPHFSCPNINVYALFNSGPRLRQTLYFSLFEKFCLVTLVATLHLPLFISVHDHLFYVTQTTITVRKQYVMKSNDRLLLLFRVIALQWHGTLLIFFFWLKVPESFH